MSLLPMKSKFDEYVKMGLLRSATVINPFSNKRLTCYQYTELTQFDRLWNSVTLAARGIVFDEDGNIVQRCIPKFFNSDEPEGIIAEKTLAKVREPLVQDKLDGSLIKVSFDTRNGLVVTSKASFGSKQAEWAKQIIDEQGYEFVEGYTYHFELIHPSNQIVLNYGDRRELVLFAVIRNEDGKDINIYKGSFDMFNIVERLSHIPLDLEKLNENGLREGIVVNFGSYRVKMKTEEYVRLHRIVTDFTPKRVWEALSSGQRIERANVPEEFLKWLEDTEKEILLNYNALFDEINEAVLRTQEMTDKEHGLSDEKLKHYIFATRKGGGCSNMVWKAVKPKEVENGNAEG